jgi:hypothetical protein
MLLVQLLNFFLEMSTSECALPGRINVLLQQSDNTSSEM